MNKVKLILLAFIVSLIPSYALAQSSSQELVYQTLYKDFGNINSFGQVNVYFAGVNEKDNGLDNAKLTAFLREHFKSGFGNLPYQELVNPLQSEKLKIEMDNKYLASRTGNMIVIVLVDGVTFPIVYHVELNLGTFDNINVYRKARIGYSTKSELSTKISNAMILLLLNAAYAFDAARK